MPPQLLLDTIDITYEKSNPQNIITDTSIKGSISAEERRRGRTLTELARKGFFSGSRREINPLFHMGSDGGYAPSDLYSLMTPIRPRSEIGSSEDREKGVDGSNSSPMHVFGQAQFWADYFNNMKKCWEPLLERLYLTALYDVVSTNK
jgi:hypothetical protein